MLFLLGIVSVGHLFADDRTEIERRNGFVNEEFGFRFDLDETKNIDLFMARHGDPLEVTLSVDLDDYDNTVTEEKLIEYETFFVVFARQNTAGSMENDFTLQSISAKINVNYLYDIKIGSTVGELEEIIGKVEFTDTGDGHGNRGVFYAVLRDTHQVAITFFQGKISHIEWYHSM